MKDGVELTYLGCCYTWEFLKSTATVLKEWNWNILLIWDACLTAHLYSKIRELCIGQGTRILKRIFHMCKTCFSTQLSRSIVIGSFIILQLNGGHMVKIPLKKCYLVCYLSKILYNLELFDKDIESYCPDWLFGRKVKMEEIGIEEGMIRIQWQNWPLTWQKNNIVKIWEGTLELIIISNQKKEGV